MAAVIIEPQQPQRERGSLRRSCSLMMSDEFWTLPLDDIITEDAIPTTTTTTTTDDDDDEPLYVELKGRDHRADAAPVDRRRTRAAEAVSAPPRLSWLLSFAMPRTSNLDLLRRSYVNDDDDDDDASLPGMTSGSDDSSSSDSETGEDDLSLSSSSSSSPSIGKSRGVTFAPSVLVRPIPHSETLSPSQRRRMYSSSLEVRQNKSRNKREYRYDGCDWRNATEEWEMSVDMVTGELVHPVHGYGMVGY